MAQAPKQASRKAILWTSVFILAGTIAVGAFMVHRARKYMEQAAETQASSPTAAPLPSALERKDEQGTTPLMTAVQMGELNSVRELLRRHVDVNATDNQGRTALMIAAEGGPATGDALPMILVLLQNGSNINGRDADGRTALYRAAEAGQAQAIDLLIRKGADPNITAKTGDSPLSAAIRQGQYEAANTLLKHGANVNAANDQGRTPLMVAAQGWPSEKDPAKLVALLLAHGADKKPVDRDGKTALDWSRSARLDDVRKLLELKAGARP